MIALQQPHFITIPDYLAGEEISGVKHEYLGGLVHAMAGASNRHNTIATNALISLGFQLRGKPCQPFNSDTKIRIRFPDHTRFYYPDAMVVCEPNSDSDHFQDQPVVIVEVLSDSTRRTDLVEKRDAYLTIPSVIAILFVESDAASVIVHRREPEHPVTVEHYSGLDEVIDLAEIGVSLSLADLYDRAEVPA